MIEWQPDTPSRIGFYWAIYQGPARVKLVWYGRRKDEKYDTPPRWWGRKFLGGVCYTFEQGLAPPLLWRELRMNKTVNRTLDLDDPEVMISLYERAKELITAGWCKKLYAVDSKAGRDVDIESENAVCFCILGGLYRAVWEILDGKCIKKDKVIQGDHSMTHLV